MWKVLRASLLIGDVQNRWGGERPLRGGNFTPLPPLRRVLPLNDFEHPRSGKNFSLSRNFFPPCPIPPSKKFFLLPDLFPHLKIWFLPCPFPPSLKIIWPIPCPHHPSLPYPHPLSQKSKFISPSYIFYFLAHIPLLNFFCSSLCISPSRKF